MTAHASCLHAPPGRSRRNPSLMRFIPCTHINQRYSVPGQLAKWGVGHSAHPQRTGHLAWGQDREGRDAGEKSCSLGAPDCRSRFSGW